MNDPFVVFGLPRSRTAWLAMFLSHGGWICHHDALLGFSSVADMRALLGAPRTGTVDTMLTLAWPVIRRYFPRARFVVVKRPVAEVRESLARHDWHFPEGLLEARAKELDAIASQPGTVAVSFDDLKGEAACRAVFEHCLQQPMDRDWYDGLRDVDIQVSLAERKALSIERTPGLAQFFKEVFRLSAPVTVQTERWAAAGDEIIAASHEHFAEVGGYDGEEFDPNVDMIRALDQVGMLHMTTARAGNYLAGYLAFVTEPSVKNRRETNAVQSAFYVRPPWRGRTGLAMHRHAVSDLRFRGVDRLTLRAGIRGSGARQAALFRRMGAVEDGTLFNLKIGGA
jgi:hypothetical protein